MDREDELIKAIRDLATLISNLDDRLSVVEHIIQDSGVDQKEGVNHGVH